MISLFRHYPAIESSLPYVSLGDFPTPVTRLDRLGKKLGIGALYMKRDDISGRIYGGNKVRKLEFLLGDALRRGSKEVMTFGAVGSNHALATAVYSREVGLRSISMLLPQPNARYIRKNLLMSFRSGAKLHHYKNGPSMKSGTAYQLRRYEEATGAAPAVIPFGGTTPLGTVGFVNAAFELREQINADVLPEPDIVYIALGSMGTAVGVTLGLRATGLTCHVAAVRVVDTTLSNENKCRTLFRETAALLHGTDSAFPAIEPDYGDPDIRHGFFGEQYALYTKEGADAIVLVKDIEGITLEGTYTGKTFAALKHDAASGKLKDKTVLFWNTLNSRDFSDAILDIDYKSLPKPFHVYFEEDVQPLDMMP